MVSGLPLPIVPWHFFATLPSVFLTLLDEFGVTQHPSLLLQGYWTSSWHVFDTLVISWHFPTIPQSFLDVVKHPLMALLYAFQFFDVARHLLGVAQYLVVILQCFLNLSLYLGNNNNYYFILKNSQCPSTFLQCYIETLDVFPTLPNNPWCLLMFPNVLNISPTLMCSLLKWLTLMIC